MKIFAFTLTILSSFIIGSSFGQSKVNANDQEWIVLFDGSNLNSWRGYKKENVPDGWQIVDKELVLTKGGAGDLITKEKFENFELELEWKISEGGNSGIFFNIVEEDQYKNTYETAPEMQILDDEKHPDAKQGKNNNRKAGSLYDLIPSSRPAKPAGKYNKVKIKVQDGHVEYWLNGERVVVYQLWNDEWDKLVEDSKFKGWPGFAKYKSGHIGLQDHGDKVAFRNIRIRRV